MTTSTARRRAHRLLDDAHTMSLDLLQEDILAAPTIAARAFVFIAEAARLSRRTYTPDEQSEVIAKFVAATAYYSACENHTASPDCA